MTEEELREELLQEQKEGSKVLPSVSVTVVFTGTLTFEYENVTYEEAKTAQSRISSLESLVAKLTQEVAELKNK